MTPDSSFKETALKALGRLDSSAGVPVLIEALGDDRGRVAIYPLRSALKGIPKAEVFDTLKRVPSTKVTVAKEIVRLIEDLETEEAFEWAFGNREREFTLFCPQSATESSLVIARPRWNVEISSLSQLKIPSPMSRKGLSRFLLTR